MVKRAFLDAGAFATLVAPAAPRRRGVTNLHALFEAIDPDAGGAASKGSLVELSRWVRGGGDVADTHDANPGDAPQLRRVRLLVHALEQVPECRQLLAGLIGAVLREVSVLELLVRLGLPADRGFFGETMDRLSRRFLPEPVDERDAIELLGRLFPKRSDLKRLADIPHDLAARLVAALDAGDSVTDSAWDPLRDAGFDALRLIALRVAAVGLFNSLRERSPHVPLEQSPFFLLPRATDVLVGTARGNASAAEQAAGRCLGLVQGCDEVSRVIIENLERFGVSVDVVYRLELISKSLSRYQMLIECLTPPSPFERVAKAKRLLVVLLDARLKDRALVAIVTENLHLLARKVIERAGETGEHYITVTRGDYFKMLLSAGGGGFLTTGTTALKYAIGWMHFAPFVEGSLSAGNYAGSFLLMQFLGLTLATKQPSMTAAALASSMRESAGQKDLTNLVTLIARITRSQLAAAIGNVGVVIPTAFAFDRIWLSLRGSSFLDAETANYVIHSLHPTESGTVFYAALTGVLLWVSSLGAGWLENWSAYRRLPQAIAEHRLKRFVGRRMTAWAARKFQHNISGVGGNATLGLLLGMTPVFGKFFGLPLDVRHVTLSTGALTLAVSSLGAEALHDHGIRWAALGIAVIGTLNFGVSFVLALLVALRAREVGWRDRLRLLASVALTFVRSPFQFVFPPSAPLVPPVHGPVSVRPPPVH